MNQIENNLMWPRFEAIGQNEEHYPNSPYKVGQVIELSPIHPYSGYSAIVNSRVVSPEWFDKYPHLFKRLFWWQQRNVQDLNSVQYLKDDDQVIKVDWILDGSYHVPCINNIDLDNGWHYIGHTPHLVPATESEYLEYTNQCAS